MAEPIKSIGEECAGWHALTKVVDCVLGYLHKWIVRFLDLDTVRRGDGDGPDDTVSDYHFGEFPSSQKRNLLPNVLQEIFWLFQQKVQKDM